MKKKYRFDTTWDSLEYKIGKFNSALYHSTSWYNSDTLKHVW